MNAPLAKSQYSVTKFVICLFVIAITYPIFAQAQPFERCVDYALNSSFPKIAIGEASNLFVTCKSQSDEPTRGQKRPNYSESEIKNISDTFEAVSDCLEINPQWFFPKLMLESGFHPQIQNPGGDAGIGQLTSAAISDVDQVIMSYKRKIFASHRKSCQWIKDQSLKQTNFWKSIYGKSKCYLLEKKSNPLRNMLYSGIFQKLNEKYVSAEFEKKKISKLLQQASYIGQDHTKIKKILLALGYNTGGAVAVRNLEQFLSSRIDYIRRKSQEYDSVMLTKLPYSDRAAKLSYVTNSDFDFTNKLASFFNKKNIFRIQIQQKNPKLTDAQIEVELHRYLKNVSVSLYSFPEWLLVWQSHGGPGYVSGLAKIAQDVENKFGADVCTNSKNYFTDL